MSSMLNNNSQDQTVPLARRLRPVVLEEFVGQRHLLSPGKPLYQALLTGRLHSMILWGAPGTGKTTLAELLATAAHAKIERLSAVLSGVKDIRAVIAKAQSYQQHDQALILFVDEVHRFNKAQQDAFLPHVEQGLITLIGATTENPSFALNNALLSRARVYALKALQEADLMQIIGRALTQQAVSMELPLQQRLAQFSDGDARVCLNLLEVCFDLLDLAAPSPLIDKALLQEVLVQGVRRFDNGGDYFYDQISALHKSVRGSDPDAALYWLIRMIDAGCDPHYLARRLLRIASEDIGNADPRALTIALDAWQSYERLGSPEGELVLAQAVVYLACAPKSNAVYQAFNAATADIKKMGSLEVPLHLRNAPTSLMRELNHSKGYRYAHDEPGAFAAGENYFPEGMSEVRYYQPVERGLEIKIKAKLEQLRELNTKAGQDVS